jgi:hypothetical protein
MLLILKFYLAFFLNYFYTFLNIFFTASFSLWFSINVTDQLYTHKRSKKIQFSELKFFIVQLMHTNYVKMLNY